MQIKWCGGEKNTDFHSEKDLCAHQCSMELAKIPPLFLKYPAGSGEGTLPAALENRVDYVEWVKNKEQFNVKPLSVSI